MDPNMKTIPNIYSVIWRSQNKEIQQWKPLSEFGVIYYGKQGCKLAFFK